MNQLLKEYRRTLLAKDDAWNAFKDAELRLNKARDACKFALRALENGTRDHARDNDE